MKRLWGAFKTFWDRLQVGDGAALVGLSEFGGYFILPPDHRLDEPQRAPFRPGMFRDLKRAEGGEAFRPKLVPTDLKGAPVPRIFGTVRLAGGTIHYSGDQPVTPRTKEAFGALVKAAAEHLRHPELDRWADDGGPCA